MTFDLFLNFNGNCREAMNFYADVFQSEVQYPMTYGEMPEDPNMPVADADKDKITYACVSIFGSNVMFMDMPEDMPLVIGNNITPTLGTTDKDEINRIFARLKEGGRVDMELQKTFFCDWYGMVTDKFGISWQFCFDNGKEY